MEKLKTEILDQDSSSRYETEWNRWKDVVKSKPQDIPYAIDAGKNLGVPEDELLQMGREGINECEKHQLWGLMHSIMTKANIGSEEERRNAGEHAYNQMMDTTKYLSSSNFLGAMRWAEKLWGKDSSQYKNAEDLFQKQSARERKEQKASQLVFRLTKDSTFDEFLEQWAKFIEEGPMGLDIDIEADMRSIFGEEITKKIFAFLNRETEELGKEKIVEFFEKNGFKIKQIEDTMSIKFKKPKK